MYTPVEYDSIFGNTHCGVPNPFIPHASDYPTRFHGPVFRYAQQTDAYSPATIESAVPLVSPGAQTAMQSVPGVRVRIPAPTSTRVAQTVARRPVLAVAPAVRKPLTAPSGFGRTVAAGVDTHDPVRVAYTNCLYAHGTWDAVAGKCVLGGADPVIPGSGVVTPPDTSSSAGPLGVAWMWWGVSAAGLAATALYIVVSRKKK